MDLGTVLVGLFLLVYVALAVAALRRPLLARLAFREAVRRPWQSALLVGGLMTGSAAILCMNALIDSAIDSTVLQVEQSWGRVDLQVSQGGAFFNATTAGALASDPAVRSRLSGVQPGVDMVGAVTDLDRDTVRPSAHIVGFDPSSQAVFGSFTLANGRQTDGGDLASGGVLISMPLADALGAHIGDRLRVTAGDRSVEVTIAGISQPQGAGAFGFGPGRTATVFSPLTSLPPLVPAGQINVIRLTAGGQGQSEIDRAHEALPAVRSVLSSFPQPLYAQEVKADDLKVAGSAEQSGRGFFTSIGMIIVIAGLLLVVNLMLALSEERRPRLAVLRAIGVSRSGQVLLSVFEGAFYSLAAGIVGIIPGLLLAWVMLQQVANAVGARPDAFRFSVQGRSVVVAVAAGTLITLLTAAIASFRGSRMSIASAVKNQPDRRKAPGRRRWLLPVVSVLAIAAIAGVVSGQTLPQVLGGTVLVVVAALVAGRRLGTRPRAVLLGAGLTGWGVVGMGQGPGHGATPWLGWLASMLVATFGLTILITAGYKVLEIAGSGWGSGRVRALLRPPLAYMSRRPIPAALGMTTTAVVFSGLFLLQQSYATTEATLAQGAGAYNVAVVSPGRSTISIPDALQSQVATQVSMTTRVYVGSVRTFGEGANNDTTNPTQPIGIYSLSAEQLAHPVLTITNRSNRYRSDADVWRAIASDPTVVLSHPSVGAADVNIELQAGPGLVRYRSAGTVASPFIAGIIGSAAALKPFDSLPVGQTVLLTTTPGTDSLAFARLLQKAVVADGAQVVTLHEALARGAAMANTFVGVFELLLTVGLLVGISSLGIIALRAVIERRRTIGVLRAIGYQPRAIMGGVLLECLLTATFGAGVGLALGLVEGYTWVTAQHLAGATVDWAVVARTVALILGAVLLVAILPAIQASKLPPAEALRIIE